MRIFGGGCQTESEPCTPDGSIRYVSDDEYLELSDENIEIDDTDGESDTAGGDSGGPWLAAYGTGQSTTDLINHGVIMGVHTGQYLIADDYASSTFGTATLQFILEKAGDSAVVASSNTWTRPCFVDWCHYRSSERNSLIVAAVIR